MKNVKSTIVKFLKVLVAIEIGWLVLGNLFLNTPIGPWAINMKPDKFTLHWESGWTPYPVKVNMQGIRVNIHTWSMDTEIIADWAETSIRLLPLLSKRLVIDGLKGGTASIVLKREIPDGERPEPAKPYPGLTIDIRNASVESINKFVFNELTVSGGETTMSGSAQMQIRGDKVIENVDASWKDATFQIADRKFPRAVSASIKGGMTAFNPRVHKGLELMEKLNGHITVNGVVGSLSPLKFFFPGADWIEDINGEGSVAIDAEILKGRLQEGTVIDINAHALLVDFLGFRATGSGTVYGRVENTAQGREGKIELKFDEFELSRRGSEVPLILGSGLQLVARAPDLGMVKSISDLVISLHVPDSEVPDITVLDDYLPPSLAVSISDGSAVMRGEIEVSGPEQLATGELHINGQDLVGSFRDLNFQMDLALDSRLSGEQLDDFELGLKGTQFRLFNGVFDNESVAVDEQWWMTLEVPDGTVTLSEPARVEADVKLAMKDTRAIIAMFSEVKDWVSRFDGFLTVTDVTGSAKISVSEKRLSVRDLEITGDRLDMVAELRAGEEGNDAIVWGKLGIFSVGLERIGDKSTWKLINGRKWFDEKKSASWQ